MRTWKYLKNFKFAFENGMGPLRVSAFCEAWWSKCVCVGGSHRVMKYACMFWLEMCMCSDQRRLAVTDSLPGNECTV